MKITESQIRKVIKEAMAYSSLQDLFNTKKREVIEAYEAAFYEQGEGFRLEPLAHKVLRIVFSELNDPRDKRDMYSVVLNGIEDIDLEFNVSKHSTRQPPQSQFR